MALINKMIVFSCALIVVSIDSAIGQQSSAMLANIPGARTATGIVASSANGASRYLAPDVPALTAIGGLPMRGSELANQGISRISSGLNSGAQSLSRAAANNGDTRMSGMEAMESAMPGSIAQIGGMMHGAIRQKSNFIRDKAERGVQAGERLRNMMQQGLNGMSSRSSKHGAGNMLSSMQDTLMKSSSQIQSQLKQSLEGHMGRMQGVQGIGENVLNQARGIGQTLTNGLTNTLGQLQKTGEQVKKQLQGGLQQNQQAMSGIMSSMQGSMDKSAKNMQGNMEGLMRQAQGAVQQVSSQLQEVATKPMELIQSLGNSLGNMMPKHTGGSQSSGRY